MGIRCRARTTNTATHPVNHLAGEYEVKTSDRLSDRGIGRAGRRNVHTVWHDAGREQNLSSPRNQATPYSFSRPLTRDGCGKCEGARVQAMGIARVDSSSKRAEAPSPYANWRDVACDPAELSKGRIVTPAVAYRGSSRTPFDRVGE